MPDPDTMQPPYVVTGVVMKVSIAPVQAADAEKCVARMLLPVAAGILSGKAPITQVLAEPEEHPSVLTDG